MSGRIPKDSVDRLFDYNLHLETRTLYIGDIEDGDENLGVGPTMSQLVLKAFVLFNQTPDKPVTVLLNTFGGCWFNGMAIHDMIKSSPCHVTIDVLGSAMSMGSIILQAGDTRRAHENATLMIHDGYSSANLEARSFENWGDHSKSVRKRMYEIYS